MSYTDQLNALADKAGDRVVGIVESWQEGLITTEEAISLIVAVIEAANGKATVLADLSLTADLTLATGALVGASALVTRSHRQRLTKAATTLLETIPDTPDPQARARRLGRSEPLTRAAQARGEAIEKSPIVTGWSRQLNGDACQLCQWWRRGGQVWPKDHPMPTHPGCTCTQKPVTVRRKSA